MRQLALAFASLISLVGCDLGQSDDDGSVDDTSLEPDVAGDPKNLNIGFDGQAGPFGVSQFGYFSVYFQASTIHPGPFSCHTYVSWDVATEPAVMGDATSEPAHRPAFEYWLKNAQAVGQCEEVLISFKGLYVGDNLVPKPGAVCPDGTTPPCDAPGVDKMQLAFTTFLATDWAAETGYTGKFAFTPWNEPNNQYDAGNGLGKVITPHRAAEYYLMMEQQCLNAGCKVAAGDLASNGFWPEDFRWNCANDNIQNLTTTDAQAVQWCRHPSSKNPGNQHPASWLDRYKNYIALHAADFPGVPDRPEIFAYHGWHDANEYVDNGQTWQCTDYESCTTRRLLKSLSGSWGGVVIWDTEVGSSQGETLDDDKQACGAAFLVKLHSISSRIHRMYYTRMHNSATENDGGQLVYGPDPQHANARPALGVLANRQTKYTPLNGSCYATGF
jgi:hypothetical protein